MEILTQKTQNTLNTHQEDQPVSLPPYIIGQLEKATHGGTRDYHKGYQIISDYLSNSLGSEGLRYWFRKAVEINRNDKSSIANQHIRGANAAAAKIDGREMSPERQQELSDSIGRAIIENVIKTNTVPKIEEIVQTDVVATLNQMTNARKNDLSNWAGSYYYWNTVITLEGETKTIGEFITADKAMHDKFIQVQAGGLAHAWNSGSFDKVSEFTEVLGQFVDGVVDRDFGPNGIDRGRLFYEFSKLLGDQKSEIRLDKDDSSSFIKLPDQKRPNMLAGSVTEQDKNPQPTKKPYAPHILKAPVPQETDSSTSHEKASLPQHKPRVAEPLHNQRKTKPVRLAFSEEQNFSTSIEKPQLDQFKRNPEGTALTEFKNPLIDDGLIERQDETETDIDIATLTEPTADMIAHNVFVPDENGHTNLTEEAKIWKKNKKVAVDLIKHAGRFQEFEPLLAFEALS